MSRLDNNISADVQALLLSACEEDVSQEQLTQLELALSEERTARLLLDCMQLDVDLRAIVHGQRALEKSLELVGIIPATSAQPPVPELCVDTEHPAAPTFFAAAFHSTIGYFSQEIPFSLLIATVVTGLGLLVGSLVHVSHLGQHEQIVKTFLSPMPTVVDQKTEIIGRITGMVDCRWADLQTETFNGANVLLGRRYALRSGLMEITYDTGAKVILQGPVTYEVESAVSGYLSIGKLTAKLEKKYETANPKSEIQNPKLFTVKTPTATVTDLGTEFGVEVNRDREVVTHVFAGKVRLTMGEGQNGMGQEQVISAGHTVCVGVNGPIATINNATADGEKRFIRAMPRPEHGSRPDIYAHRVLSMQPALYYRMDQPKRESDRNAVFDSAPGGHHGELHSAKEYERDVPYKQGHYGDSLCLLKPPIVRYVIVPDYPKAAKGQLTVAAYVFAESRPERATIASNWTTKLGGQFCFGLHDLDGDLSVILRSSNGSDVVLREGLAKPLPLYQWQHVAFVADGSTASLYRNGVEVASQTCAGIIQQNDVRHLAIGCRADQSLLCKPSSIMGSTACTIYGNQAVENLIDGSATAADIGTTNKLGGEYAYDGDHDGVRLRSPAYVSMDFGAAKKFNLLAYSQRPDSPSTDSVDTIKLWFSSEPFSLEDPGRSPDETLPITELSQKLTKYDFTSTHTAQYVLAQLHMKEGVDGYVGGTELLLGCTAVTQSVTPHCFWHGRLDEVVVFNRALTAEQVWQLFAVSGKSRQASLPHTGLSEQDTRGLSGQRPERRQ